MVGWIEIIYEKNGWLDGQKKKWIVGWIKNI